MNISTNLEKRIKRHVIGPSHACFAITLPGFESVCAREIGALGDSIAVSGIAKGGVFFNARLVDLLRANLFVRTAVRVLMRLAEAKVTNFAQLESLADKIPWDLYLPSGDLPAVRVSTRHSRLYHSQAVALRLQERIRAFWQALAVVPVDGGGQTLFTRLENDRLTVSLDSSGESLYQRGFKSHRAHAPLRETMAAAILELCGFSPVRPLVDPMCGAGTFALEAAMKA
jgi:putative N6-adenine-specific DNA methylase